MAQQEFSGERKLGYSQWHRYPNLPGGCYAFNIDFVEVRDGRPKGFFEIAETKFALETINAGYVKQFKFGHLKILQFLSNYTKLPSFVVFHNADLRRFKVFDVKTLKHRIMDEEKYKEWLIRADFE